MNRKLSLLILFSGILSFVLNAQRGFAIFIDVKSYEQAKKEVEAYAASVNKDGLKAFIIVDKWQNPDSIRATIISMYNAKTYPLEGAVFIGDIPIPMIRDAQHFTSAFKMNQTRFEWQRSSVPSDRFYDDFDLKFNFLKRDSANSLYFYYSLTPQSAQILRPEIYTGRIKPFETNHKYDDLKAYLTKVVQTKAQKEPVDEILYFVGYGYNSESALARIDEKIALIEQFPWLKGQRNRIEYIDHNRKQVKPLLQNELQRKDLKLALLHHHGDSDIEYLSGEPEAGNPQQQMEALKLFFRSKVRSAVRAKKDTMEAISYYVTNYKVDKSWVDNAFDPELIKRDSINDAMLNIVIPDVLATTPNARFIILDACFNGSFHLNEYLAGAYIFNTGNTIAVQANTVNALQDKWANEFLGLSGLGVRLGKWSGLVGYLESHIIGDPSFRFKKADIGFDVDDAITAKAKDNAYWKTHLKSQYPDLQALALRMLYKNNAPGLSDLLLETFKTNDNGIVRMECLKLLTGYNDDNFITCLQLAADDSYELVQRQAIYLIGKSGDERLIPALVKVSIYNNTSERVNFCLKEALSFFSKEKILTEFDQNFDRAQHYTNVDTVKKSIRNALINNTTRWLDDVEMILDNATPLAKRLTAVRYLRNYNMHNAVDGLCAMLRSDQDEELLVTLAEALGWYNLSYKKQTIINTCKEVAANTSKPKSVRDECLKTVNRLQEKWYR